ncbi:MAG: helix-turn-helix domain-containing protein [Steroidobacteraceae bacterium]
MKKIRPRKKYARRFEHIHVEQQLLHRGAPYARKAVAKAFGKVLKEVRAEHGYSQEELAAIAEMDRTYPSLMERGKRTPTLWVVFNIASVFHIRARYLIDRTEAKLQLRA